MSSTYTSSSEDLLICPRCEYVQKKAGLLESEGDYQCEECGTSFSYVVEKTWEFFTRIIEPNQP